MRSPEPSNLELSARVLADTALLLKAEYLSCGFVLSDVTVETQLAETYNGVELPGVTVSCGMNPVPSPNEPGFVIWKTDSDEAAALTSRLSNRNSVRSNIRRHDDWADRYQKSPSRCGRAIPQTNHDRHKLHTSTRLCAVMVFSSALTIPDYAVSPAVLRSPCSHEQCRHEQSTDSISVSAQP